MDVVTAKALEQVNCKTQTWKTEPEILVGLELHKNKIKSVSLFMLYFGVFMTVFAVKKTDNTTQPVTTDLRSSKSAN